MIALPYDIDSAPAAASPPPWITTMHPEVLPVGTIRHTRWFGGIGEGG